MSIDSQDQKDHMTFEALDPAFHLLRRDALWNNIIPIIVITVMWPQVDHVLLILWGLLFLAGNVAKYVLAVMYIKQDVKPAEVVRWAWRLVAVFFYISLLWASTAFLFFIEGSVEYQIFLIVLLNAIVLGSGVAGLYWYPLYCVRAIPIMSALVVRLAMEGTYAYTALAVLLLIGLGGSASIARLLNKSMRDQIRMRHESIALNKALEIKTGEAQQAALAKSRFLAAASHDLRQPLHALSLFIGVLKEEKSASEREEIFSRIDLSLDTLRKLFDELLDISRLDAGAASPEHSHFDIAELLNSSLVNEFKSVANEKGIRLRVHVQSNIVVSDRLLLERILRNLIGNAIRYTESGGVLISARNRGNRVLVQVWDTGIGIPADFHEEIFSEFHQLNTRHRNRNQGLGLGLAIVKRLCKLLDHPLQLHSQPNRGSVFGLNIAKGHRSLMVVKKETSTVHGWELSGRRILIIDDEKEILDAMGALLTKWGCDVTVAQSAETVENVLREKGITPDLILADLHLGNGYTGVQVLDNLRMRLGKPIPGILITGETASDQIKLAKDSVYAVLHKPVKPTRLRSAIQQHLSPTSVQ